MKRHSKAHKEMILKRLMSPEHKKVSELAKEYGISAQTLYMRPVRDSAKRDKIKPFL